MKFYKEIGENSEGEKAPLTRQVIALITEYDPSSENHPAWVW